MRTLGREGAMSENLAGDIASRFDFKTDRDHFKGGPMLVFDKIFEEFRIGLLIVLICRV